MKIILGPNLHRGAPPHNYGPLFFGPWVAKFGPGVAKFCPGGPVPLFLVVVPGTG